MTSGATGGAADTLAVERLEVLLFRGRCHSAVGHRAFGGQVLAQALRAAGQTVPEGRGGHTAR